VNAPTVFRARTARSVRAAQPCFHVVQGTFNARPIVRPANPPGSLQAKNCLQRRPGSDAFQVNLRPKSGGWPLPRDVQAKMEAALGANFSDVRVHVGPEAASIGAIAFTWGSEVHFSPGQYNPHTPHGQFLLGHELAHVVQQRAGRVANPFGSGVAVVQDQSLEAEADRLGRMAAASQMPQSVNSTAPPAHTTCAPGTVNCKMQPAARYNLQAPAPTSHGWSIRVAVPGMAQPVGSLQMTRNGKSVFISDLKVAPEHRRQGVAGQLLDAAVRTARCNGFPVAQLEARADGGTQIGRGQLVSMYQSYGFHMTGLSPRGNPFMERRA